MSYRLQLEHIVTSKKPANKWTSQDKFHESFEIAALTEAEQTEYCKKKISL